MRGQKLLTKSIKEIAIRVPTITQWDLTLKRLLVNATRTLSVTDDIDI